MMRFFIFREQLSGFEGNPYASRLYSGWTKDGSCPGCGTDRFHWSGPGTAEVEGGWRWSDVIGSGSVGPPFMVSERVIEAFHRAKITGFVEHPVVITAVRPPRLERKRRPNYYWLEITGLMDVDLEASGVHVPNPCPVCHGGKGRSPPRRWVPLYDTWDESDLFTLRQFRSSLTFCSERVLMLARQHKWTNFRFDPIDVVQRHATKWSGIDYLAEAWPPQWYPEPPSKGRSFEEWVQWTRISGADAIPVVMRMHELTDPSEVTPALIEGVSEAHAATAAQALLDFPEQATRVMIEQIQSGNELERRNAAKVLCRLRREWRIELPQDIRDLIRKTIPNFDESLIA